MAPPLWARLLGCVGFIIIGLILATHPAVISDARHPSGEVQAVGWAAIGVFTFAGVSQVIRAIRSKGQR